MAAFVMTAVDYSKGNKQAFNQQRNNDKHHPELQKILVDMEVTIEAFVNVLVQIAVASGNETLKQTALNFQQQLNVNAAEVFNECTEVEKFYSVAPRHRVLLNMLYKSLHEVDGEDLITARKSLYNWIATSLSQFQAQTGVFQKHLRRVTELDKSTTCAEKNEAIQIQLFKSLNHLTGRDNNSLSCLGDFRAGGLDDIRDGRDGVGGSGGGAGDLVERWRDVHQGRKGGLTFGGSQIERLHQRAESCQGVRHCHVEAGENTGNLLRDGGELLLLAEKQAVVGRRCRGKILHAAKQQFAIFFEQLYFCQNVATL